MLGLVVLGLLPHGVGGEQEQLLLRRQRLVETLEELLTVEKALLQHETARKLVNDMNEEGHGSAGVGAITSATVGQSYRSQPPPMQGVHLKVGVVVDPPLVIKASVQQFNTSSINGVSAWAQRGCWFRVCMLGSGLKNMAWVSTFQAEG